MRPAMQTVPFFLFLLVCAGMPAAAQTVKPLDDAALASETGGFSTPGGLQFNFGAMVSTYVDGRLALQSQLTWTAQGPVTTSTATASDDAIAAARAAGIQIGGTPAGAFIPGINGGTFVLHDLDGQHLDDVVVNTADNRDIRQETSIYLNIPDLPQYQAASAAQQAQMQLQDSVDSALSQLSH